MRKHCHYCGWMIQWDNETSGGFRFWICEPIYFSDAYLDTALHHLDMFPSVEEGVAVCEGMISSIITAQAALTYRLVSEYYHSRYPLEESDPDKIPF